jgi:hypothetical protein
MGFGSNAPPESNKLANNAATGVPFRWGLYAHISRHMFTTSGKTTLQLASAFAESDLY